MILTESETRILIARHNKDGWLQLTKIMAQHQDNGKPPVVIGLSPEEQAKLVELISSYEQSQRLAVRLERD